MKEGKDLVSAIRQALATSDVRQKDIAEAAGIDAGNLSNMLTGRRSLSEKAARVAVRLLSLDEALLTDVRWVKRQKGIPYVPIGALPMGLNGKKMAKALQELVEDRLPDVTGDKGLFYVQLDEAQGGFAARSILFVAPHKKLFADNKVLVRANGRHIVATYQIHPDGPRVSAKGIGYSDFEVLGRVIGHMVLEHS